MSVPRLVIKLALLAAMSAVLIAALLPHGSAIGGSDKLSHFLAFYALGLLAVFAWSRLWIIGLAGLGLILFGGAIEYAQGLVGRDRQWLDWAADAAGVICAMLPVLLWEITIHRPPRKQRSSQG